MRAAPLIPVHAHLDDGRLHGWIMQEGDAKDYGIGTGVERLPHGEVLAWNPSLRQDTRPVFAQSEALLPYATVMCRAALSEQHVENASNKQTNKMI